MIGRAAFVVLIGLALSLGEARAERRAMDLASNWRFQYGVSAAAPQAPNFDDSAWAEVAMPHTWNRLGEYRLERSPATNNARGVGWYRLRFNAPAQRANQRSYLEFDGVGAIAQVWLNGARVGEHRGAFSRFRFDVTEYLRPGENLLAVSADNSAPRPGSSTEHVIPLAGDFFVYGGIYRGVRLISVDDAHIDLQDYGGPGVYALARDVSASSASVDVLTRLRNSGDEGRNLTLVTTVRDARRRVAAHTETSIALSARAAREARQTLSVSSPHLWNGRAGPYLYSVTVQVRDGAQVVDSVTQPLGIRSFRIDANDGFFLNGAHVQLVGASRHQDREGRGWALTRRDHAEDMAIMLEMGANTVRHAHYQHAQEWADEADRAGMVVWAEAPFVTASSFDGSPPSRALVDNARQQTIELIRQNYNHPSIFMWSVGNEVDAAPLFLRTNAPSRSLGLLRELHALARAEDPSRPTVFADCCEDVTSYGVINDEVLAGATDLIGYNRYYGWYYGHPDALGGEMDRFHAKHPEIPISISEYGAGGALSQHSDNPEGGAVNAVGRPHPEEYQSWYHERSWLQLRDRRYVFASWIWNMFDFASDMRAEGEAIDLNDKGLVSFDRRTRKDAFYFYQANWSREPMLHLTGRRYVNRVYPVLDVRAYSNADSATLTVNGRDLGQTQCQDRICVWPNVVLRPGENRVRARARFGRRIVGDEVRWIAPDPNDGLRIDAGDLAGRETADGRFGSDNFFTGGAPVLLNNLMLSRRPGYVARAVEGEGEHGLFEAYREGEFTYNLPLPDGAWRVRVLTYEPDAAAAATRTFNVLANGQPMLSNINPAREAGAVLRTLDREFTATAANGEGLRLQFQPVGGPAIVAAIVVSR